MKEALIFVAGLAVGAAGMWLGVKKYYKSIADDEIESVKESFKAVKESEDKAKETADKADVTKKEAPATVAKSSLDGTEAKPGYKKLIRDYGGAVKGSVIVPDPYIINPDEYDQANGYAKEVLVYYDEDNTLASEDDEILLPEKYVGTEWVHNFGRYEKDIVHVRNEAITTDYEIQMVYNSYERVCGGAVSREEDS